MTTNKSLKHAVRARMSRTGERYTAARHQVLAKAPQAAPPPPMSEADASREQPLHGPTSRSWPEWVRMLDEWGARDRPHGEIARWLAESHSVPPWWTQDITVRYEKHIGRRVLGQRGSTFSATATKTIAVPADVARAAWLDDERRARWLPDVALKLRPNKVDVAKRFDVNEGDGRVVVGFEAKGDSRVRVAIEHEKLPDAAAARRWTMFWRERLSALRDLVETDHAPDQ